MRLGARREAGGSGLGARGGRDYCLCRAAHQIVRPARVWVARRLRFNKAWRALSFQARCPFAMASERTNDASKLCTDTFLS